MPVTMGIVVSQESPAVPASGRPSLLLALVRCGIAGTLLLACSAGYGQIRPGDNEVWLDKSAVLTPDQVASLRLRNYFTYLRNLEAAEAQRQATVVRQIKEQLEHLRQLEESFQGRWETRDEKGRATATFVLGSGHQARREGANGAVGVWNVAGENLAHVVWSDGRQDVLDCPIGPFVGRWRITTKDEGTFYMTLESSFKARKTNSGAKSGKWEIVGDEARVTWDDGWRNIFRRGKKTTTAFKPGISWDDPPTVTAPAVREADVRRESGKKLAFAKGARLKEKPTVVEKIVRANDKADLLLNADEEGKFKEVLASIKKKTNEEHDSQRLLRLARQLADRNFSKQARERYQQVIDKYPDTEAAVTARKLLDKP
jgi:hypothetical protein